MIEYITYNDHDWLKIICQHCGKKIDVPVYCGNRFCDTCSPRRLNRVKKRITWLMNNAKQVKGTRWKHLTLTIRSEEDLPGMIKNLICSFRRLRQRAYWKCHVTGGAFVIEITNNGNNWHAHIHAVISAYRIDWEKLRNLWVKCSRGSTGVYITNAPASNLVHYLTKYLTKIDVPNELKLVAGRALKHTRLFQPFGTLYALNLTYRQPKSTCPDCKGLADYMPYDIWYSQIGKELDRL